MIGHKAVVELLVYDKQSGRFFWKNGSPAGSINKNGYIYIGIGGKKYLAHRLAWLFVNGRWPSNCVDHINGVKADNRIENLREATMQENLQNQRKAHAKNRSSGLLGVSWDSSRGRWDARIKANGRQKCLGRFATKEQAHAAYLKAKAELHPFQEIVK